MTEQYAKDFVKQALSSGIPREKIAALLSKATEIQARGSNVKVAAQQLDSLVTNLLTEAGFDKNASSVAYAEGILKEALDNKCSPETSIKIAKIALAQTKERLQLANKLAEISQNEKLAEWTEGFIKAAVDAGYDQTDATKYAISLIEQEKVAFAGGGAPQGGGDPSAMFKQPVSQGAGLGGPGEGGQDPTQGIDPQLLQQILALIAAQGGGQPGGQPGGQAPAAGLA